MGSDWVFPALFAALPPIDPYASAQARRLTCPNWWKGGLSYVLTGEGLGDLDLDLATVAVLAVNGKIIRPY